jgi:2-C-methyl-D-erythritol 2,4-cyclodiphosphate synthase
MAPRIGQGFDIHRLVEGRPLVLAGVEIRHDKGLLGHSDGDAVLHAVCDAILGALGAGDIGSHFPDTDESLRGAPSSRFLAEVVRMMGERRLRIGNLDLIIFAERPRLRPHMPALRASLAAALQSDVDSINLKAKTMEGLGPIGEGEAIAASAVVLLVEAS